MIAGDAIKPAARKALVVTLQAATGAPRSACGNAIASLIADGCATQELVDLHQRAAALLGGDRRADRCPRCLEARPLAFGDRCRECEIERLEAKSAGRVRHAPPGYTTPEQLPPSAPPLPATEPVPPAPVLDRIDLEDVMSMCSRKRAYPSQIDADRVARRCEARRRVSLRSYSCPACGHWHITKQPARPASECA